MTTETRAAHSPLGASGAERWMNCPGSVALLKRLDLPETEEPEYRSKGTSAHSVAYQCLVLGKDAWEFAGQEHGKHEADLEIMDAVQIYIDECRELKKAHPHGEAFYEFEIAAPDFHPEFFGTLDFGLSINLRCISGTISMVRVLQLTRMEPPDYVLFLWAPFSLPGHRAVDLAIVQPRAFHPQGPIRRWKVSADTIRTWAL